MEERGETIVGEGKEEEGLEGGSESSNRTISRCAFNNRSEHEEEDDGEGWRQRTNNESQKQKEKQGSEELEKEEAERVHGRCEEGEEEVWKKTTRQRVPTVSDGLDSHSEAKVWTNTWRPRKRTEVRVW